jgi:hypothetical protein
MRYRKDTDICIHHVRPGKCGNPAITKFGQGIRGTAALLTTQKYRFGKLSDIICSFQANIPDLRLSRGNGHWIQALLHLRFPTNQTTIALTPLDSILGNEMMKSWTRVTSVSSVSKSSRSRPPGRKRVASARYSSACPRLRQLR